MKTTDNPTSARLKYLKNKIIIFCFGARKTNEATQRATDSFNKLGSALEELKRDKPA